MTLKHIPMKDWTKKELEIADKLHNQTIDPSGAIHLLNALNEKNKYYLVSNAEDYHYLNVLEVN